MAARDRSVFGNEGADERSLADVKSQRPDTPMLVSPRAMRKHCCGMVANKPGAPGRLRISVKTIAQGMPACSGFACGTCRLHFFRRRAMGEAVTRHSLRPLHVREGRAMADLGRYQPRECDRMSSN
ncbi:hypothetical protein ACQR1Y_06375 [Bradyrhizobium sp. HKCCYLRH3099]|uniref:hypothetical protein n=1 Tax=unclassified Bradyrhizobium TaxID=2631580 RepID=UPI003EBCE38C